MTVGIIGLGIMGGAYAHNLLAAGVPIRGVDPTPAMREKLVAMGGVAEEEMGDWLADCDLIIISLASPKALGAVSAALAGYLKPGQVVLETGTFAMADKLAAQANIEKSGAILLDCPVSGTGAQAAVGDLVMMASGPADAIAVAKPFMAKFTRAVIEAGPFGAGIQLKYVANHAVAIHNTAAAETLNYADALGLDRQIVYHLLSTGAAQSRMSDLRMPLMISGAYDPPTASLEMFAKDISIISASLAHVGVISPLFDETRKIYEQASATLPKTYDAAAVFEVYKAAKTDG